MANPNFLELEWKTRRALDIVAAHEKAESSEDYRSALQTALRRFKRMTRETDSIYRDWRATRGERMKTFRELRRESDRAKDLCDEHALDDYPDQKIAYTEEEHLEDADAFIALPGGMGTLEASAEIFTWAQLGLHSKPCGLLNVAGYYDRLIEHFDHAESQGFLWPEHREIILFASTPDALLARFEAYDPPRVKQWIDESET